VVLALAEQGHDVAVHYRTSGSEAENVAAAVRSHGVKAVTVQADLTRADEVPALFEKAVAELGPLDVLINNASMFPQNRLTDFTAEDLALNVQIHAMAPLVLCRAFAAQDRPGTIVNFLDARIVDYDAEHAAYHLSKRMLYTLTRMMALEFAPGIRVNGVAPGPILPPPGAGTAYLEAVAAAVPLRRVGSVRAVTEAVLYLVNADYVTGQVLFVDGGRHLKGSVYS
jgi:NAD(P)-dependent dehydrogenase (short-subunit alcohol dehydrogenase family)